jgi:protein-arginine kinase
MQNGADIGAVFSRLARAANEIEKEAKFAHNNQLGYITSCPTNLGTALRASVHIHLPLLSQKKDQFEAIADKYHVQIRGAHGEHTETHDGIFDISNKRRLGRSEVDLVQDMYDGVKAMIEAEKALRPSEDAQSEKKEEAPKMEEPAAAEEKKEAPSVQCGPHLKRPDELTGFPEFPAGTKSALSVHLTKKVWDELHD